MGKEGDSKSQENVKYAVRFHLEMSEATHTVSSAWLPKQYLEEDDTSRQVSGVGVKLTGPQL